MSTNQNDDKVIPTNMPANTEEYYEIVASQEEIYLEETEEELRAILISEDAHTYVQAETTCVDCYCVADSLDEELDQAAEQLITGDSDDPPLSEEDVADRIRVSRLNSSNSL